MEDRGAAYVRDLDILLDTCRRLELTPPGRRRHVTEFPARHLRPPVIMIESPAVRWLLTALFAAAALRAALLATRTGRISEASGPDGGSVLHDDVRGFGRHHLAAH
jgi:hypothetical protein